MTMIRTTCVDCGDIDVAIDAISLERSKGSRAASYQYDCPDCGTRYRRPASNRVFEALIAMGAARQVLPVPNPITHQEIAEFVADLDMDKWIEELDVPHDSDNRPEEV